MTLQETIDALNGLVAQANQDITTAHENLYSRYLGRRGKLSEALARTGALTPAEREAAMQKAQEVKTRLEAILPR